MDSEENLYLTDLNALFGIDLELGGDATVPRALDLLDEALDHTQDTDLRNLRAGLKKLRQLDAVLGCFPASALLRGFQVVGKHGATATAKKLGMMSAALSSFVRVQEATLDAVRLWAAVVHAMEQDRAEHREPWLGSLEAWSRGLDRLRREAC